MILKKEIVRRFEAKKLKKIILRSFHAYKEFEYSAGVH